jgi:tetratricopeptide (TPR) repeat protein
MRAFRTFLLLCIVSLSACSRSAQDYLTKANKLLKSGKYGDAVIEYRKAIQRNPNLGDAYYGIGVAEMAQDKGLDAYQPLERAVQLMPSNEAAKVKLADVTLAIYVVAPQHPKPLYEQIERLADQLLAKSASSFDALRLKGSLRLLDRNPKAAISFFEKADKTDPMRPDLIQVWVQALFMDGQDAEGTRLAQRLIDKDKTFGPIYDVLYNQYVVAKQPMEAENILKMKVANNPKNENYLLQLARHYGSAHNTAEMNNVLQRLLGNPSDFPDGQLQAGNLYADLNEPENALRQFESGSQAHPQERLVYQKRIVDVLLAQGKKDEATRLVDLILKDGPKDEDTRRVHATLLLETGKPENVSAARAEFQSLVATKPNDARVRFQLARAYMAEGNLAAGRAEFMRLADLRKDDVPSRLALATIALNRRNPQEALQRTGEILTLEPGNNVARLLRAHALIGASDYLQAKTELTRMEREHPNSPDVQIELGLLATAQGKYKDAEEVFRKLGQTAPTDPRAVEGLVETLSIQKQLDSALELLEEAIRKNPTSLEIGRLLAVTATRSGKFDLAIEEYQKLLAKDQKASSLRLDLAEVYALKGDLTNAIATAEQAKQFAPNDPQTLLLLASFQEDAGRNADAQRGYLRVLELQPDNAFVMNDIAFLLADTGGNLDEALGFAQKALQKSPGQPILTDTLGWIYLRSGKADEALQIFNSLVKKQPEEPAFRYHLGAALLKKGDKAKARVELEEALANRPARADQQSINQLLAQVR